MTAVAHYVNTQGSGEGDEGGGNDDNKPKLKEYLSHIPSVYAKLEEAGMSDIDTLIYLNDNDSDVLCGKEGIGLNVMQGMKFKAAIRKLRAQFAPKKERHIVTISKQEQKELNEIEDALKQASDLQSLFSNHFNGVEDNVAKVKSHVDQEFDKIFKTLEIRKQSIHKQVQFFFTFV